MNARLTFHIISFILLKERHTSASVKVINYSKEITSLEDKG